MGGKVLHIIIGFIGGLLMTAVGVSPDEAVSNISKWAKTLGIENIPTSLIAPSADQFIFWIGLILIIGSALHFFWLRKDNYPQKNSTPTKQLPIPRKHDVWLADAAHYIVTKDWGAPKVGINDKGLADLYEAEKEIQQQAVDGDLPIWGMNNFAGPLILIDQAYWERYGFDIMGALLEPEEWKTENKLPPHSQSIYHSLKTSKAKVEELWPLKEIGNDSNLQKIRRIRELFADGVAMRNNAATLRIVDAEAERKMSEIREKLTKEMDKLAPVQAINLHTINTFDSGDHPPTNLQDPQPTLIFSEFLLRVQKILEGYK